MVRMAIGIFALVAVCATIVLISRVHYLLVESIQVKGNTTTPSNDIVSLVHRESDKKFLFLFPKKNIALFPASAIESQIKTAWPNVHSVHVQRTSLTSVEVAVVERQPRFLWCGAHATFSPAQECFSMDKDGYIFGPATANNIALGQSDSDGHPYLAFYSTVEEPLGNHYTTTPDEFRRLVSFIETVRNFEIGPRLIQTDGREYHIILESGTKLLIRKDQDLQRVADHLKASLSDPVITTEDGKLKDLIYLDLRFNNKVYYKLR